MSKLIKMNKYKYKLYVETPLHIGNGEKIYRDLEMFIEEKDSEYVAYVMKLEELFKDMSDEEIENVTKEIVKNSELKSKQSHDPEFMKKYYSNKIKNEKYVRYKVKVTEKLKNNTTSIGEFIKVNNRVYIPGSSIKGAFVRAMNLSANTKKDVNENRKFAFSDSNFKEVYECVKIVDVQRGKQSIKMEVILPDDNGEHAFEGEFRMAKNYNLKEIAEKVNRFTKNQIDCVIKKISEEISKGNDKTLNGLKEEFEGLKEELEEIEEDNTKSEGEVEIMLRMGRGSSRRIRNKYKNNKIKPFCGWKTYVVEEDYAPMGFVILKLSQER